jgi:phosphoenolpyruvate---glycerone phosphotransferase subunit DhaL
VNAAELRQLLEVALTRLQDSTDELRDLDAAIGDGDLGVTVGGGARAVLDALGELPDSAGIVDVLRTVAKSFASARPSTISALVAAALLAASRRLTDPGGLDRDGCVLLLQTSVETIQARGGAQLGDKTILDAMSPSLDALVAAGPDNRAALGAMIEAADRAVVETARLQSGRGRAAWVGERTIGHPDGGATAYLRFLEALADGLGSQAAGRA